MGILSFVKKQFIDILQWTEAGDDVLAWRFPTADSRDPAGRPARRPRDADGPVRRRGARGRSLRARAPTRSAPGTSPSSRTSATGTSSSSRRSRATCTSSRPGSGSTRPGARPTRSPSGTASSARCGCGASALRLSHRRPARLLCQRLRDARNVYAVADLEGQLRSTIISTLTDHLGESQVPFLDMAANQDELARAVMQKARPAVRRAGSGARGRSRSRTCRCPTNSRSTSTSASAWASWAISLATRSSRWRSPFRPRRRRRAGRPAPAWGWARVSRWGRP